MRALAALSIAVAACRAEGSREEAPNARAAAGVAAQPVLRGRAAAERYCQSCHLLPDPAALDRATWKNAVLPMMGHRLGVYARPGLREDSLLEPGPAGELVRRAGIFPEAPQISPQQWRAVVDYYLSSAPERLPEPPRPWVGRSLPGFRVRIPGFRTDPPMTTLVAVDTWRRGLYAGDTKQDFSTLEVLDSNQESEQSIGLESAPSHLRVERDSLLVLLMGKLLPTDEPSGLLRALYRQPGQAQFSRAVRLIDGLQRPVHAAYADLNADGREDVVISEFGFRVGRLAWYERTAAGGFQQHVLRPLPGAVRTEVRDFDGDGRPDVLALMAQGDEGVFLYHNLGQGQFREERLLRFPPYYGSTSFQTADFDHDGHFDILYTNGDNGDYAPVAKPYHGIRIFLNDGKNHFQEAFFFPLHGAFRALARDFDGDGNLDVAAIAFYPEYRQPAHEGFVYLQGAGKMRFSASTFPEVDRGRWLAMDAGDVDGDGDADLVLGSFVAFDPTGDTTGLHERWLRGSPSVLILENTRR